ncbi:hypothetical protein OEZ84_28775, partial [Leclercia adecarboxylata]|uniref:hypothetical protein n=1 Tax=Leclercia adecarboxylata TaxID=83655 RepID=UPI00234DADF7
AYVGVVIAGGIPSGRGSMPNIFANNFYRLNTAVRAVGSNAGDTLACVRNSYREMDSANCTVSAYEVSYTEGSFYVMTGSAYPTISSQGTWIVGDRITNTAPATGAGKMGWVCTVAGNPGTWKAWG